MKPPERESRPDDWAAPEQVNSMTTDLIVCRAADRTLIADRVVCARCARSTNPTRRSATGYRPRWQRRDRRIGYHVRDVAHRATRHTSTYGLTDDELYRHANYLLSDGWTMGEIRAVIDLPASDPQDDPQ